MNYIDVFNGDADGICSLVQMRNANPQNARLITGVKRDIDLLKRIDASPDDHITVLDISYEKNSADVQRLLEQGAVIEYFDHHKSGALANHPRLKTVINDQSSTVCTGLLVDQHLGGKFRAWALVAAFGDNLNDVAMALGKESGFDQESLSLLQRLGIYINYNSYGESLSDLFFHPDALFQHLQPYATPFDFIQDNKTIFSTLEAGYKEDMASAEASTYLYQTAESAAILFQNAQWARRVSGVYINDLANQYPGRAHALITENADGTFRISIRSPLERKGLHADELASQFVSGGGRKGAAGINALPADEFNRFVDTFKAFYA
ncbi:MAG: DHH family phosphoesterase [Burkholderiales bacterium]|nr:DHH family phosphoesterase [Nitrosomonas sp.]MCP5273892.1 DHH family phosphoesterase [Burkholderiales bacterium]